MDREALCKTEMNEKTINQLITEIVRLRFRIEEVQREKDIDVRCLRNENARLRSEIGELRQCFNEGMQEMFTPVALENELIREEGVDEGSTPKQGWERNEGLFVGR